MYRFSVFPWGLIVAALGAGMGLAPCPSLAGQYVIKSVTYDHNIDSNTGGNGGTYGFFQHEEDRGRCRAVAQCRSWVDPGSPQEGPGYDAWADVMVWSKVSIQAQWRGWWFGGPPQGTITCQQSLGLKVDATHGPGLSEEAQAISRGFLTLSEVISWPEGPGEVRHEKSVTRTITLQVYEQDLYLGTDAVVTGDASRTGTTGQAAAGDITSTDPNRANRHEALKTLSPVGQGGWF